MSRPGTSSTVTTPDTRPFHTIESSPAPQPMTPPTRLSNTRVDASRSGGGRKLCVARNGDISSPQDRIGEETRRESISSRGSWIRRLSTIPNSQTNSPRSSVGPDSPSLTFSHGSAAPILSNPGSPAQLPPNKLVKRASSGRASSGSISRTGSKPQVPTLRRPATSHQRSVTLQQQFRAQSVEDEVSPLPFIDAETPNPPNRFRSPEPQAKWRPFFASRPTKLAKERSSGRSSDGGIQTFYSTSRRVLPDESVKPTLVKPSVITKSNASYTAYYDEDTLPFEDVLDDEVDHTQDNPLSSTEKEHKRPRRSLSMHFSSSSSWMPRSGSIRGSKRNPEGRSGGKRYSSAPVSTMPGRNTASAHGPAHNSHRAITDPTVFRPHAESSPVVDNFVSSFQARSRNSSSPLPPLSRLSSFNLDLARLGLSSSSSSTTHRSPNSPVIHNYMSTSVVSSPGLVSPTSPSYFVSINSKSHRTSEMADRASTLIGSDTDGRGFTFGDEDDMDFQSETVFDSLRSGATGSIRSHGAPLDSMFDESPPSVNGSKAKRLSIHELLGNGTLQEGSSRIVEEDEGMSTPVKDARSSEELNLQTPVRSRTLDSDMKLSSSPPSFSLATKDFGRLSLDDEEEDEDWTRDDENSEHNNQLSPPSSSLNSRRVSPSFRAALADLTYSGSVNGSSAAPTERPKSNLFDWSEPSSAEKLNYLGNSPRPKTAYVKQVADGRGGRTIGRRGPSALHIRSQSVPVVPDVANQREHSKLAPKFGTWGLGGKGVSEEWDGDFEFDSNGDGDADDDDNRMEQSGMLVPPAIQASQENVVGHVGQIREVCLLVEDLKRLRLLAREKDLLNGPSARLWKEAEGIIALAVPDEEDTTLSPPHSPSTINSAEAPEDIHLDHGLDAEDISRPEAPFEVLDRHGRPTGYMYDGNTVRRRSVFSPDDDIFGAGAIVNNPSTRDHLRPPANNSPRHSSSKTSAEYARTVMETMHQHRSTSDPLLNEMTTQATNKMPFDTTSLRDLVHRASVLSRTLSDLIRKADGSLSPEAFPQPDSSPAFTRVFTDPTASPPKHLPRSQSNNSVLSGSIDSSPTQSLGQRMHMMTVI
jgi:hypothetical protein